MSNHTTHPGQNRLLAELSAAEAKRLRPHLEPLALRQGDVLHQRGGKLHHVYFPDTAIVSIQYELEDGATSEIASVGCEGVLGVSLFMGGGTTSNRAVVQYAGGGHRLRAALLLEEFHRRGPLFSRLLRYTQALMTQMSQTAVCNAHHSTLQRMGRWLLQTMDRAHASDIAVTQEALGAILGVRREGITEAARRMQQQGLISCRRGHVQVLSRPDLERQACECYGVMRRETARLLAPGGPLADNLAWQERQGEGTRRSGRAERRESGRVDNAAGAATEVDGYRLN